jgi:AraC-like DNA-binding protein
LTEASVKNREESLLLMDSAFENLIAQIDQSITLSQNYFKQYKNYFDQGRYTILLQLQEELNAIGRINYVHNICVYYRDWGYTLSSDLTIASLEYYPDADFLRSLEGMNFRYRKMLVRNKPQRGSQDEITVLTLIRSIPDFYVGEYPDTYVVIDIDLTSLGGMMGNIFPGQECYFSIVSSDDVLLASVGSDAIGQAFNYGKIPSLRGDPSGVVTRQDYGKYLALSLQSPEREWTFVYIEPYETMGRSWFSPLVLSFVVAGAFVFLMSVLGSLFFSKRIFNPIKTIFEKTNILKNDTQKLKETDLILQKIDQLIQYNNQLEQEKSDSVSLSYPFLIENKIFQAFKDGDWEGLESAADEFMSYCTGNHTELEKAQGFYLRLFCGLEVFFTGNSGINHDDAAPDYRQVFTFPSVEEINRWMLGWFSRAFNHIHAHTKTHSRLLKEICEYIDANLGDDISAKGLWRQFGYHPSTLRKLFREELHITLKSYVDSKRIEKAKELLVSTNLKVQDIAAQTGYLHTQSFIVFFREAVHCTPTEYRERHSPGFMPADG